jgi:hypothetical protein
MLDDNGSGGSRRGGLEQMLPNAGAVEHASAVDKVLVDRP